MLNNNRFVDNWKNASKTLRTGKKPPKRKTLSKQNQARRTGFLIGALREMFKDK